MSSTVLHMPSLSMVFFLPSWNLIWSLLSGTGSFMVLSSTAGTTRQPPLIIMWSSSLCLVSCVMSTRVFQVAAPPGPAGNSTARFMSMGCTVMALGFSTVLARRSICSMEEQQGGAAMARILAALFGSVCCRGKHS